MPAVDNDHYVGEVVGKLRVDHCVVADDTRLCSRQGLVGVLFRRMERPVEPLSVQAVRKDFDGSMGFGLYTADLTSAASPDPAVVQTRRHLDAAQPQGKSGWPLTYGTCSSIHGSVTVAARSIQKVDASGWRE